MRSPCTRPTRPLALLAALIASLLFAASASAGGTTQLLVKFRSSVAAGKASNVIADHGARQVGSVPDIGVRVVSVPAAAAANAKAALNRNPDVKFAERNGVARAQETVPDDPYFPQGTYGISGGSWGWYRSHTTQAWDVTTGDPSVKVAILDTGLKTQGLDFNNQVVDPHNVLTGSTDVGSSSDNHGTYVAGTAGLAMNTGSGNAGYCPGCKIMPVQIANGSTANFSDMATGVTWATDHGARVINLSWAGTSSSSTLANAVSYARSHGAVVFAAAGNSNCDCQTYPASTPGVLGVGGVNQSGTKANDSNYGSWVAVAAPEANMTAWPTINGASGYAPVGGTSLASPAAAGIAALVLSARPTLSGSQLEQTLESSAKPASFTVRYGELDAMTALQSLGISDPQTAGVPANAIAPKVLVETNGDQNNAPLTNAPQVGNVLVRGQGSWSGSAPLTLSAVRWYRCNPDGSGCTVVGSSWKYTTQSADTGYALKLSVTFTDPDGSTTASAALTAPVGGSAPPPPPPPPPSPPANTALPTISGTAQDGQTLTASTGTWSNSPTSYAYAWQRCDSTGASCSAISGATGQSYLANSADVGSTLRIAVTATNSGGSATATSTATGVVQTAPPPPPPPATTTTTFSGNLNKQQASQSFNLAVGSGDATATLTFSKLSSLTLTLIAPDGSTVGTVSGASGVQLTKTLAAGGYRYVVSGSGLKSPAPFTLSVTAQSP